MRASSLRPGSALIEVLVGLTLLTIAGTALVTLLGQTAHSMRSTLLTEHTVRRASAELDRLVVLDRAALVAAVGRHRVREWVIDVTAFDENVFDVGIAESDTTPPVLRTTVYRPFVDSSNVTR